MAKTIWSMEHYHALKSVIVKDLVPDIDPAKLIVTSLTPLGEMEQESNGSRQNE